MLLLCSAHMSCQHSICTCTCVHTVTDNVSLQTDIQTKISFAQLLNTCRMTRLRIKLTAA